MKKHYNIGILGLGVVGSGVVEILQAKAAHIKHITGKDAIIAKVCATDPAKARQLNLLDKYTANPDDIVNDPDIDIVVEVMGGVNPASNLIATALKNGKAVVTANKEVIAKDGAKLFDLAKEHNRGLFIEATVGGGIPVILPLKRSLSANNIFSILGIVNGTTNYILTKMSGEGRAFSEVLKEAQDLGYAEADPTNDVEGYDARYKIAILASIIFGKRVNHTDIYCEGISNISPSDIKEAHALGYEIKLIAKAAKNESGILEASVYPAFLPFNHPLASVRDAYNAIFVEGDAVGKVMFYGRGAGQMPTASAVVGDIINLISDNLKGDSLMGCLHNEYAAIAPLDQTSSQFYIRLETLEKPGVLAFLGTTFAKHNISVKSVAQHNSAQGSGVDLVLITHKTIEKDLRAAISELSKSENILSVKSIIRVIED